MDITPIFGPERMAERQGEVDSDARLSASRELLEEAACLLAGVPPQVEESPPVLPQAPVDGDPETEASLEPRFPACPFDPQEFLWFVWNPGAMLPGQRATPPGESQEPERAQDQP